MNLKSVFCKTMAYNHQEHIIPLLRMTLFIKGNKIQKTCCKAIKVLTHMRTCACPTHTILYKS